MEDDLFRPHSEFWDRVEVLHRVAAREHTMVGVLSGTEGERSMAGVGACSKTCAAPLKQAREHYRTLSH